MQIKDKTIRIPIVVSREGVYDYRLKVDDLQGRTAEASGTYKVGANRIFSNVFEKSSGDDVTVSAFITDDPVYRTTSTGNLYAVTIKMTKNNKPVKYERVKVSSAIPNMYIIKPSEYYTDKDGKIQVPFMTLDAVGTIRLYLETDLGAFSTSAQYNHSPHHHDVWIDSYINGTTVDVKIKSIKSTLTEQLLSMVYICGDDIEIGETLNTSNYEARFEIQLPQKFKNRICRIMISSDDARTRGTCYYICFY